MFQTPLFGKQQGAEEGRERKPGVPRAQGARRRGSGVEIEKKLQRAGCACRRWAVFALYRKIFIFKTGDSGDFVFSLTSTELSVALEALPLSRD